MLEIIAIIIGLVFFTGLCILGFHAATRPNKALSFLGQEVESETKVKKLEEDFLCDLAVLNEDLLHEYQSESNDKSKSELLKNFVLALDTRIAMFETDQDEIETSTINKKLSFFRRLLRPISIPFSECTLCMSSLWSTVVFTLAFISPYLLLLVAIFAVAGLIELFEGVKSITRLSELAKKD